VGREFLTDVPISFQTYEEEKVDIHHHIFPQAWCKSYKIEHKRMDCIVNKTAISARTNRSIGGAAPSKYLPLLEKQGIASTAMDEIPSTHLISSTELRNDNFDAFFELRHKALMELIVTAMGKTPATSTELSDPVGEPADDEDDTNDELEVIEAA
jgi:hypothetical protein